jgi:hypothetical protein
MALVMEWMATRAAVGYSPAAPLFCTASGKQITSAYIRRRADQKERQEDKPQGQSGDKRSELVHDVSGTCIGTRNVMRSSVDVIRPERGALKAPGLIEKAAGAKQRQVDPKGEEVDVEKDQEANGRPRGVQADDSS